MAGGREGSRQELEPAAGVLDCPPIPHSRAFGGQTAHSGSTGKIQARAPTVIAVGISYSSLVWSRCAPSRQLSGAGAAIDTGHQVRPTRGSIPLTSQFHLSGSATGPGIFPRFRNSWASF